MTRGWRLAALAALLLLSSSAAPGAHGFAAFQAEARWPTLLAIGGLLAFGALVSAALLARLGLHLGFVETVVLSLSGAPLVLAGLGFLAAQTPGLVIPFAVLALGITARAVPARIRGMAHSRDPASRAPALMAAALLAVFVLVKAGYIAGLAFPLYIDSVNHVDLIRQVTAAGGFAGLQYYHYGFHGVVILITRLTGDSAPTVMLFFGQLLQVIAPFSVYAPVSRVTGSLRAALVSVMAAGLGWSMPSQATSWGKYPALMAAASAVFAVTVLWHVASGKQKTLARLACAALVSAAAVFVHSRMLILLGIGLLAGLLCRSGKPKTPLLAAGLGLLAVLLAAAWQGTVFARAWQPYVETLPLFALLVALLPWAVCFAPREAARGVVLLCLAMLTLLAPAPQFLLRGRAETLIDPPFFIIFLFIPLSAALGVGLAGLERWLGGRGWGPLPRGAPAVLLVALLAAFPNPRVMAPLPGVNYAAPDDLRLYAEIRRSLPVGAKILVPNHPPLYGLGIDGGAWVPAAAGRETVKYPYSADFTSAALHQELCRLGVGYVYAGAMPYSFPWAALEQERGWYRAKITCADTRLYEVIGCE